MPITEKPTYQNENPDGTPIGDPVEYWPYESFYWHYKTTKTWPETKTKIKQWFQNNFPNKPSLGQFLSGEISEFTDGKTIRVTWGDPCQTTEGWLIELGRKIIKRFGDKILTETLKVASVDLLSHAEAKTLPKAGAL